MGNPGKGESVVYIGEYNHTLDDNGRISLPKAIVGNNSGNFIIVRGIEKCLYVFDRPTWDRYLQNFSQMAFTKSASRAFQRLMLSGAYETEYDAKGRITINQNLIIHASLSKECVIIGAGDKMEIWNREIWNKYFNENLDSLENIAEQIEY